MKIKILFLALMLISLSAYANPARQCIAYSVVAMQVMDYRIAGLTKVQTQKIVDLSIDKPDLPPDAQFAIAMLPDLAYDWPDKSRKDFARYIFQDCMK